MPKNHDILTLGGFVKIETNSAYLFEADDSKRDAVWLPKSQVEWDEADETMQIPEWLALEKGLI
jgi:hypothetical protein